MLMLNFELFGLIKVPQLAQAGFKGVSPAGVPEARAVRSLASSTTLGHHVLTRSGRAARPSAT